MQLIGLLLLAIAFVLNTTGVIYTLHLSSDFYLLNGYESIGYFYKLLLLLINSALIGYVAYLVEDKYK